MNTNFVYDNMDYYSILEYLKTMATYFSEGSWTDFSDADIGTVILKLIAMNADTTNFQVEKGISELYLDTVVERLNAVALCKLIGYEPRHYLSAYADITAQYTGNDFSGLTIPAYTRLNVNNNNISYYNIEEVPVVTGTLTFKAYEGTYIIEKFSYNDIDKNGRLILSNYNVGTNTVSVSQAGTKLTHITNALYGEGEACFSVHIDLSNNMYIQLPTYYANILSTTAEIEVQYLLSSGSSGSVGAKVLSGVLNLSDGTSVNYYNENASEGGYDPETISEIKKQAPAFASTMNTLVTLNDFRILVNDFDGIADVVALDYNYSESGLVQPTDGTVNDAYKVNLYILPEQADSIYKKIEAGDDEEVTLTSDDFDMITDGTYGFTENTGVFSNTNHDDDTTAETIFVVKNEYKSINIQYSINTEENSDILYIDVDGENKLTASGHVSGNVVIENVVPETNITLVYAKDASVSTVSDSVNITFIGKTSEGEIIYTTEYLDEVQKYVDDVKSKKPAGIQTNYLNVEYIRPKLTIRVYMDEDDLRYDSTSASINAYLVNKYSRDNFKIGDAMYISHISKDILSNFSYINYLEILNLEGSVNGAIKPNRKQFVELLSENITVKVVPYEES